LSGLGNWFSQLLLVTLTNLRTLPQRAGPALAAAVGVAGVLVVMVSVLAIAEGFRGALATAGSPENAIVLRGGSNAEMNSWMLLEDVRVIADAPGIRRGPEGPLASAELFVMVDVPKRSTGTDANVPLRGVQPAAFDVRGDVRIVEGRRFEPGRNEIIVGVGAAGEFEGLEIGNTLHWDDSRWTVVGLFSSGGSLWESELWCDVGVLQPAFRRGNSFQAVYTKLERPEAFETFKDALTTDPRLDVMVERETDYFIEQSAMLHGIITGLGFLVAGLMGVGAVFGAVNTMYSAVAARTREIATLRALGFGAGPVVLSVLVESMLLALAGGLVGGIAAYAAFNGYRAATLNWASFSQVTFAFTVTPEILATGLVWALLMGLLGGLLPAWRAARLPVAAALREL
jgi:putative ABC transport system permease protein